MNKADYMLETETALDQMVQNIVESFDPDKIILFGSYAWGAPQQDSDIDLLVVIDSDLRPAKRSAEISLACRPPGLAVDLLVKTPTEIDHRLDIGDPFIRRILEQGKILYARRTSVAVGRES